MFCLGPYRFLEQINFTAKAGDSVTIKAADCAQDAGEYVVFSITIRTQTWTLRSDDGTPLWYFGRCADPPETGSAQICDGVPGVPGSLV